MTESRVALPRLVLLEARPLDGGMELIFDLGDRRASVPRDPRLDRLPALDSASGVNLAATPRSTKGERARPFSREQLDAVLRVAHPAHRPMLRLLAGTGLRWGEVAALRRGDLALDGSRPQVRVRRAVTKGGRFKPPKSRHGRRDVPLSPALVSELRGHLAALPPGDAEALAFPSRAGTPLAYPNALRRVLRPAAEEAGAPWAGFHTFRHTFASLHIAAGTNIVALSRMLGHHSPEFTLRVYAHLIPGDVLPALDLEA